MHKHIFACASLMIFCGCHYVLPVGTPIDDLVGKTIKPDDPENDKAVQITNGGIHVCALLASDRVKCWGDNQEGQCHLKAARNANKQLYDVSNAPFSKISASFSYTCGILKGGDFDQIPMCFGKEGAWLDVPHEKVHDIVAGPGFTCFIKADNTLGCVGPKIGIVKKKGGYTYINPADLPKHGIDGTNEDLDYSKKTFVSLKAEIGQLCAQQTNGTVLCMGSNIRGQGESIPEKVSDYFVHETGVIFLNQKGKLVSSGAGYGFNKLSNISNPKKLKYRKILDAGGGLLTASGNTYDNGSIMPENTYIPFIGDLEESVVDVTVVESSRKKDRVRIRCSIKNDNKISCVPHIKEQASEPEAKNNLIIKDLPRELAH